MNPEEINKNHFRNIALEHLQSQLKLVKESTVPNKSEYVKKIIQNFLEQFKDNELVGLTTIEQVKEELKKLEKRQKAEKARDDDDAR